MPPRPYQRFDLKPDTLPKLRALGHDEIAAEIEIVVANLTRELLQEQRDRRTMISFTNTTTSVINDGYRKCVRAIILGSTITATTLFVVMLALSVLLK